MRRLAMVLVLFLLSVTPVAAQDGFDARRMRGSGAAVGISVMRGEWLPGYLWSETVYDLEGWAVEAEYRRFGVRGAVADLQIGGESADARMAGVDMSVPLPRVPVSLVAGIEYQRAEVASGTLTSTSLPIYLMSDHALDFGGFWIYPLLAVGTSLHRTSGPASSSGARPYGRSGIEVGVGGVSIGARLQHHLESPQTLEAGVKLRF